MADSTGFSELTSNINVDRPSFPPMFANSVCLFRYSFKLSQVILINKDSVRVVLPSKRGKVE